MLDPNRHARIIADRENLCATAGIQGRFLDESMGKYCSDQEVQWVVKFWKNRKAGILGMVMNGLPKPDSRCQAIAGAFIRNYIDARVMPLNTIIDLQQEKDLPSPTVLLIPNLFIVQTGKALPPWRIQIIHDILIARSLREKLTVVYVEDLDGLRKAYGKPFYEFLESFTKVSN